jgi:hypothetical protein
MLVNPPPVIYRKRPGPVRPARAGQAALMLAAVQDISAVSTEFTCTLVFNTTEADPIAAVEDADPGKWSVRYQGGRYGGFELIHLTFNTVELRAMWTANEPGDNQISYAANPSDIADESGRELAAFEGFAI